MPGRTPAVLPGTSNGTTTEQLNTMYDTQKRITSTQKVSIGKQHLRIPAHDRVDTPLMRYKQSCKVKRQKTYLIPCMTLYTWVEFIQKSDCRLRAKVVIVSRVRVNEKVASFVRWGDPARVENRKRPQARQNEVFKGSASLGRAPD